MGRRTLGAAAFACCVCVRTAEPSIPAGAGLVPVELPRSELRRLPFSCCDSRDRLPVLPLPPVAKDAGVAEMVRPCARAEDSRLVLPLL